MAAKEPSLAPTRSDQRTCVKCGTVGFPKLQYVKYRQAPGLTTQAVEDRMTWPVSVFEQPTTRLENLLHWNELKTLGDLIRLGEKGLIRIKNFGKTSLREVKGKLADIGLALGSEADKFPDTIGTDCSADCLPGEHLHIICCACGYRQWEYCADHVEAPASEGGDGDTYHKEQPSEKSQAENRSDTARVQRG